MQKYERNNTTLFIQRIMHEQYHCEPHALPETVFIALRDDELVGAMALSISEGGPLPLEETYALDYRTFPGKFSRSEVVQLGRWVATVADLSRALFYASVLHALERGRTWGVGEIKPKVARRFAQMGIHVFPMSGRPNLANIPAGVLPYYLLPPSPIPSAIILVDAERALREKVAMQIVQNHVAIQYF